MNPPETSLKPKQAAPARVVPPVSKRSLVAALACVVLAGIAYNTALPRLSPPLEAVYACAREHGFERGELSVLEGGYSSELLSWHAFGRFRTNDDRELYVAVVKPTPFTGWRLSEVRLAR